MTYERGSTMYRLASKQILELAVQKQIQDLPDSEADCVLKTSTAASFDGCVASAALNQQDLAWEGRTQGIGLSHSEICL